MTWLKRITLFVLTNLAILFVLSLVLRLLGVDQIHYGQYGEIDYRSLLIFSAVLGFGGSIISLLISKWVAKRTTGAQVITTPRTDTEQWLLKTVAELAQRKGIGMPEVAIFPSDDMNAFATGARRDSALVAVSTGLLQRMSRDEVAAVLGHEISHVANGDMVTLTLIQGVLNTFVIFLARIIGSVVDRALGRDERGGGVAYFITVMVAQMVLGIVATLIVMAFSRYREFRADHGSAELLGPPPMISALQRLKPVSELSAMPQNLAAFGIHGGKGVMRLFMSHPPIEERIAALQNRR